jgi:hypothetical protein
MWVLLVKPISQASTLKLGKGEGIWGEEATVYASANDGTIID